MAFKDRPVANSVMYKEDGTAVLIGSRGEQFGADIEEAVARGLVTGTTGNVFGYVGTSATTIVSCRATAYTEPASASQMEVLSSSASDASAGVGTRTVRVTYYDGSMAGPNTTDVTLNGTTAVATTPTNIRFVESIRTLTVGSTGTNVGTLTLRVVSGGATVGTVAISDGRTFWAHHYVAASRISFIQRIASGTNGVNGNIFLRSILPLTSAAFEEQISQNFRSITAQPSQIYDMGADMTIAGPARVTLYVKPDAATASTFNGGFTYYDL